MLAHRTTNRIASKLRTGLSMLALAGLLSHCAPTEQDLQEAQEDVGSADAQKAGSTQALSAPIPTSVPWVARHGMTAATYQQEFNTWAGQGYRPAHLSAYNVAGSARFAGIWEKKAGGAWVARHGLNSAQYQSEFNHWVSEGYRPTMVEGYEESGQDRYLAVWEKKAGPAWVARHGMTSAGYQQEVNYWTGQGYRISWVDGYGVGGVDYYAAIFEKREGPAYVARHGLNATQYQAQFDALTPEGYRPTHVSAYNVGGTDYYAAIWEKKSGPAWIARHRLSSSSYQHEFQDYYLRGYRLKQVDGNERSGARYTAIWEAEPGAVTGNYCTADECFNLNTFANEIENALRGRVVKYGFELRRGLTVIQRASGPGRTASTPPLTNFTVNQRFNPASVGKAITSVAMLQLLNATGVSVDRAVYSYLPSTWKIPANNKTITFLDLLNHTSGLRETTGLTYDGVKQLMEKEIKLADKFGHYQNVNYAVLRILVARLSGLTDFSGDAATHTAERFTQYVNNSIFAPLGIYNVAYKATSSAAPLFYPDPPGTSKGTDYGDWTLIPGSAGGHVSVHELAMFADATFKRVLLSQQTVQDIDTRRFGFEDYGDRPDGTHCWGKGGFFPGGPTGNGGVWNGGAQLSTSLVHCDNGVTAMLVINGFVDSGTTFVNAMDAAYTPR